MTNPKVHQGCPEVSGTSKLLQEVHKRLCRNCKANAQVGVEAGEVELDR